MCEIFKKVKNLLTILFLPLVNVFTKFLENKCVSCVIQEITGFGSFSLKVLLPVIDVGTDINFTLSCFENGDVKYGWVSGKLYIN